MRAGAGLPALLRRRHDRPGVRTDAVHAYMYPNRTLYGVETPDCYFRRFSPDGKYLIGFNRQFTGLKVFRVANVSPTTEELQKAGTERGKGEFRQFFRLEWANVFTGIGETLHRDLCLVAPSGNHVIVVRMRRTTVASTAEMMRHAHPNTLTCIQPMEDTTLLVIDIRSGELVDTRTYLGDIICMGGHNGISVYEDQLCLLSLQHQCLRMLRIERNGKLTDMQEIGWYTGQGDCIFEETLRIREARALADLARAAKRKRDDAHDTGCASEVNVLAANKRRKASAVQAQIHPSVSAVWHRMRNSDDGASGSRDMLSDVLDPNTFGRSSIYEEMYRIMLQGRGAATSPSDPNLPDTGLPDSPESLGARRPRPNASAATQAERRPPFMFPLSTQAVEPQEPSVGSSGLAAVLAGRSAIPLHTLQRLPPQYRLIFTRAVTPGVRLEMLADTEVSAIEPSLTSAPYSGLKQRLLGALFTRAQKGRGMALQRFFRSFRQYEALVLWRAQFVERSRLLLRFVPVQVALSRSYVSRSQSSASTIANTFSLVAEYDIRAERFGRIWDSGDDSLYDEIVRRLDVYRVPMGHQPTSARAPSAANDVYLRDAFESTQLATRSARSGGHAQAVRKASALLPFSPQCVQESPLLDPALFYCNQRTRHALEKFRSVALAPIRFYDRITGAVKFVLSPTPNYSLQQPDETSVQHSLDIDTALDVTSVQGASVLQSGAVLMPTGGTEELDLQNDAGATAQTVHSSINATSSHRVGIMYLFHPTLPLVLSTRTDRSVNNPLHTSNIHFHQPS
ncbi:hypothetical protein GGH18_000230 [Coemansia sp. RSA 530]|nr:hypothetical protein GGH18_000230 [Coemansia sp. RSA 530]KAJ2283807.1 hypothetical protein GGH14_000578 [Coemansia sp. RSA 370]